MTLAVTEKEKRVGGQSDAHLTVALKEWAVSIRALREGRQVLLLRKGGLLDAGGEFDVVARDVLLYPTYIHEDEQIGARLPGARPGNEAPTYRRADGRSFEHTHGRIVLASAFPAGLSFTWLGHSTFLIVTPTGIRFLIDPWIEGNPACPPDKKDVGPIDLMLITHGHFDHIADAIPIAAATGCAVVCIFEIAEYLARKGVALTQLESMNKGGTLTLPALGLSVTMVHADHSCGIKDGEEIIYGGEAVGFVVTLDSGFTFYHSGDTAVFSDMALIADLYRPSVALLPIGDRFVMSPREAARAALFLSGVDTIIPMHFGTFPLLTGTPGLFEAELKNAGADAALLTFTPGETKAY